MRALLWFKRDLRVEDHPALARAAALGPVLPLYIFEPEYWAQPDASGRQFAFVRESVAGLQAATAGIGAPLVVRVGDAVQVIADLRVAVGFDAIISHEETGSAWTFARDRRVAAWQ